MSEVKGVKGILFANGVQALATVVKDDGNFLYVENMLALQMTQATYKVDGNGQYILDNGQPVEDEPSKLYFEDFTAFADIKKTGLDTKIPWSAVQFPFDPDYRILEGYKNRTSLIVSKPEASPSIIIAR